MLRLKFERQHRQLSQNALAQAADIFQADISAFERGARQPTPEQLQRLAAVFRIARPEDLLKDIIIAGSRS